MIDGKLLDKTPFTYGYGDSYMQTAHKLLAKHGIFDWQKTKELISVYRDGKLDYQTPKESRNKNEAYGEFIQYTRDHREMFTIVCNDVNRKKDL
jgi:hypothetical protein